MRPVFKTTINMHLARSNFVSLVGAHFSFKLCFKSCHELSNIRVVRLLTFLTKILISLTFCRKIKARNYFS